MLTDAFEPIAGPHLKLVEVLRPQNQISKGLIRAMFNCRERADIEIAIPGFEPGGLSLVLATR